MKKRAAFPGPKQLFWPTAALGALVYGLLAHYFLPFDYVFGSHPIVGDDFDLHLGQTLRVLQGLDRWGQLWVYDVQLLAGQPEGTIFDGDNKGWELWTYALWKLGARTPVAFNSFVLVVMLACPLAAYASARLFDLGRWPSLGAAALAGCLWLFDSFAHWIWFVGMMAYGFASFFSLVPLALFYRFVERKRGRDALLCALALSLALVVHPYAFFILVLPMGLLYLRARRELGRGQHAMVAGIVALPIALDMPWLYVALSHWHYVLDSGLYAQGGPIYLLYDFLDMFRLPEDTGVIGVRSGFRVLTLGLAAGGLWRLGRDADRRFAPLALALSAMLALAYLGPYIPYAGQVQPYRHALPAAFLSVIPAAVLLEWLWRERTLQRLHPSATVLVLVLSLGVVQHLSLQVLYYFPSLFPATRPLPDGSPSPVSKYGFLLAFHRRSHIDYRHPHSSWVEGEVDEVVSWVTKNVAAGERVLVDNTLLGERLAWKSGAEIMGGFTERNIAHAFANFFRRYGDTRVSPAQLAHYLKTFNIRWVITQKRREDFDAASDVLEPLPEVAGRAVYRTRIPVSPVLAGSGAVHAETNRIDVRGSDPNRPLVLSYHFHEALRCRPDCRVERATVALDDVGLIRIPAPHPADLSIYNSYRLH